MTVMNRSQRPQRDEASFFARLTPRQFQTLQGFVHKRVIHQEDAEDILQQTFVEALHAESRFLQQCKLETWLCGIALNLIRNHFRKLYRRPAHVEFEEHLSFADTDLDVCSHIECHRTLKRIVDAMAALPTAMRVTLEVNVETEGSYQDAADVLGVPIGTVRSRLSRARAQLREHLPDEFWP